ncbi:MAG: DNA-binding response regulator [Gammaproteobacteria bacterium]|jgi:DNA-binding NarL/FixJ family response regulator|nr:MAG: DNA-binding response regulator [Gammaproteobacteria bacterium]PHR84110.1 MAG: DNA-binding response regulator [Colwellia sp.]
MNQAKVVIADDHPLFRTALKQAVVDCMPDVDIKEASSFSDLLAVIESSPELDIIFLDLHMPGNDGFTGLTQLQNHHPDLIVIMVSSDENPDIMQKAINFGAAAFIPKSVDLEIIAKAINTVLAGDTWLPINMPINSDAKLAQEHKKLAQQLAQLTPQQYTVLSLVADGQLNKQIAGILDIKENTVKKHVSAILLQLGVYNRTQAGLVYQQLMLAPQENVSLS